MRVSNFYVIELTSDIHPNRQSTFFNSLTGQHISEQQLEHATDVWNGLDCFTMRDYHNHYHDQMQNEL